MIRTESWVKNRDTNRIVGLVYRYSPSTHRKICLGLQKQQLHHYI